MSYRTKQRFGLLLASTLACAGAHANQIVGQTFPIAEPDAREELLANVKAAITQLATDRATIGAYQARMSFTSEQLIISKENLTAATSRIQDVDVAEESTQYARYNILVQSGTAMLAQANAMPQTVLRLLQ